VILVIKNMACLLKDIASSGDCWGMNIGPVAVVGHNEYIGRG